MDEAQAQAQAQAQTPTTPTAPTAPTTPTTPTAPTAPTAPTTPTAPTAATKPTPRAIEPNYTGEVVADAAQKFTEGTTETRLETRQSNATWINPYNSFIGNKINKTGDFTVAEVFLALKNDVTGNSRIIDPNDEPKIKDMKSNYRLKYRPKMTWYPEAERRAGYDGSVATKRSNARDQHLNTQFEKWRFKDLQKFFSEYKPGVVLNSTIIEGEAQWRNTISSINTQLGYLSEPNTYQEFQDVDFDNQNTDQVVFMDREFFEEMRANLVSFNLKTSIDAPVILISNMKDSKTTPNVVWKIVDRKSFVINDTWLTLKEFEDNDFTTRTKTATMTLDVEPFYSVGFGTITTTSALKKTKEGTPILPKKFEKLTQKRHVAMEKTIGAAC